MSEAKDNDESEQELPEFSDDEQLDAEVEEDFSSLMENSIDDHNSQLHTEAHFNDSSVFASTDLEPSSIEPTARNTDISSELNNGADDPDSLNNMDHDIDHNGVFDVRNENESELENLQLENGGGFLETDVKAVDSEENCLTEASLKQERVGGEYPARVEDSNQPFTLDPHIKGDDSGTEEERAAFMKELENFFREQSMEFKPPKFYGEGLNCLKLWRAVTRLGGYEQVTSCKLWRQVGESFKPPKTCTTISWSFRNFYEKALLEYEKHKIRIGELHVPTSTLTEPVVVENQVGGNQASGSGRARRDAAARAMQGWHSQRLLGNGEVGDPIIKDKNSVSLPKRDKHLKSIGLFKRKKASSMEHEVKVARTKVAMSQVDTMVVDVGAPADWVKINVRRTKDCFEVYALVPGLLREEVHVQSDPAGRVVISGEPEQPDNPWGVTPFKKVITLPSRIDPHQTSAVVTLHGQLFVRAPFEQPDL